MTNKAKPGRETAVDNLLAAALLLFQGEALSKRYLMERFSVSRPTAQRYMIALERTLPLTCELQPVRGFSDRPRKVLRFMPSAKYGD